MGEDRDRSCTNCSAWSHQVVAVPAPLPFCGRVYLRRPHEVPRGCTLERQPQSRCRPLRFQVGAVRPGCVSQLDGFRSGRLFLKQLFGVVSLLLERFGPLILQNRMLKRQILVPSLS